MEDEAAVHRDAAAAEEGAVPSSARVAPEVDALFEDWLSEGGNQPDTTPAAVESLPTLDIAAGATPTLLDALAGESSDDAFESVSGAAGQTSEVVARRRFVVFTVAGATYAVPEILVTEVERVPKVTPVPRVPGWLRGVTSLRGEVLSVIDLRTLLSLDAAPLHTGRLLVVRLIEEEFSTGLVVDAVDQIVAIADADITPPASPLEGALAPYLTGVCRIGHRLVAALDLDALLHSAEIRQFDDRREAEPAAGTPDNMRTQR